MRRSFAALVVGALGLCVSSSAVGQTGKKEEMPSAAGQVPKVDGKTYDQWAKDFKSPDPSRRETAFRMAASFAPEVCVKAVRPMLDELKRHGVATTQVDLSVRSSICVALQQVFATGGKWANPLDRKEAIARLKGMLNDPQVVVRYHAAQALSAFGSDAQPGVLSLRAMLKDPYHYELREVAAQTLGYIAYDSTGPNYDVLRDLFLTLRDPAFKVRLAGIQSLFNLGPPSDKSLQLDYLKHLEFVALKDPEPALQLWAHMAYIHAVGDYSSDRLQPLQQFSQNSDMVVRVQALQAMGSLGPKAKSLVNSSMVKCLKDPEPAVVVMAIWAVSQLGPAAGPVAIQMLEQIEADPKQIEMIRTAAKNGLSRIKGK